MRAGHRLSLLVLLGLATACGSDGFLPGVRGECSSFGGAGLDCEPVIIESARDACWRMVECGAIPIENPDEDPGCCIDWNICMSELEGLDDYNRGLVFACIQTATCDDLKTDRSPDGPGRGDQSLPLCFQHGTD